MMYRQENLVNLRLALVALRQDVALEAKPDELTITEHITAVIEHVNERIDKETEIRENA